MSEREGDGGAPIKWAGKLEEAFEAEVARQGGVHAARPKAVLDALAPLFPDVGLQVQNVKWHLQAHRKREERAKEWLATKEGPVRWSGALKQAFHRAVEEQGGLHTARPKALWEALSPQFPMLTVQNCKWHLQTLRKKAPDDSGAEGGSWQPTPSPREHQEQQQEPEEQQQRRRQQRRRLSPPPAASPSVATEQPDQQPLQQAPDAVAPRGAEQQQAGAAFLPAGQQQHDLAVGSQQRQEHQQQRQRELEQHAALLRQLEAVAGPALAGRPPDGQGAAHCVPGTDGSHGLLQQQQQQQQQRPPEALSGSQQQWSPGAPLASAPADASRAALGSCGSGQGLLDVGRQHSVHQLLQGMLLGPPLHSPAAPPAPEGDPWDGRLLEMAQAQLHMARRKVQLFKQVIHGLVELATLQSDLVQNLEAPPNPDGSRPAPLAVPARVVRPKKPSSQHPLLDTFGKAAPSAWRPHVRAALGAGRARQQAERRPGGTGGAGGTSSSASGGTGGSAGSASGAGAGGSAGGGSSASGA